MGFGYVRLTSSKREVARPLDIAWFWRGHSPPLSHTGQSSGWLMRRNSMLPCWALSATGDVCWVLTSMPSATVMVHEACGLGIGRSWPSGPGIATSTRHCRQAPTGSSSGWSQNRGIWMPACSAARMMSVPLGTDTGAPSMVRVTWSAAGLTEASPPVLTAFPPELGLVVVGVVMQTPMPLRTATRRPGRRGTRRA